MQLITTVWEGEKRLSFLSYSPTALFASCICIRLVSKIRYKYMHPIPEYFLDSSMLSNKNED